MLDKNMVLERYYLDCRCMLLELGATFDRLDRAAAAPNADIAVDWRLLRLRQALAILAKPGHQPNRVEDMLRLLSEPAD